MPLPAGWSATVTQAERDESHAPAQWNITVTFSGPDGLSFPVPVRLAEPELHGLTQQGWINIGWSRIGEYVLSTIAQLTAPPATGPPPSPFVGDVIQIP